MPAAPLYDDGCSICGDDFAAGDAIRVIESVQDEWCAQCGVRCGIGSDESECSAECLPVVVNVLGPVLGTCAHGLRLWIDPS